MSEARVNRDYKPSTEEPEGGLGPLRHIRAVMKDYYTEEKDYEARDGRAARTGRTIVHELVDVEVLASVEPFPWKTAKVKIPVSTSSDTRWAAWTASLRKLNNGVLDYDQLRGKPIEMEVQDVKLRLPKDGGGPSDFESREAPAWVAVMIAGLNAAPGANNAGSGGIYEHVATLADGKTEEQFNQVALSDDKVIAAGAAVVTLVTERQMVEKLVSLGMVSVDNTVSPPVLHKVAGA